jgi:hypothetical protein
MTNQEAWEEFKKGDDLWGILPPTGTVPETWVGGRAIATTCDGPCWVRKDTGAPCTVRTDPKKRVNVKVLHADVLWNRISCFGPTNGSAYTDANALLQKTLATQYRSTSRDVDCTLFTQDKESILIRLSGGYIYFGWWV